jgi:hypothetical protein
MKFAMLNKPEDIKWIEGELPDVSSVSEDCWILAWFVHDFPGGPESEQWKRILRLTTSKTPLVWEDIHGSFRSIELVHLFENELNPLKWVNSSGHPIGWEEKVKYWAWVKGKLK